MIDRGFWILRSSIFRPVAEVALEGFVHLGHLDADGGEFGGVHRAVGARGLRGDVHELGFVFEEDVVLFEDATLQDVVDDLAGGDLAGVGDVVGAEGDAFLPARKRGGDKLLELGDGIGGFEQTLVAHELCKVVARALAVIEGNAEAPKINVGGAGEDLFAEGLGAAVKGAVVLAEGEIGGVGLDEAGAIGARAGEDATGGDMAPRHAGGGAGLGDAAGEDGVAVEALGLVELAGVDVGFAGIAGGVDEEGGLVGAESGGEDRGVGVVHLGALEVAEGDALLREEDLISLADVAGTAEEIDHVGRKVKAMGERKD